MKINTPITIPMIASLLVEELAGVSEEFSGFGSSLSVGDGCTVDGSWVGVLTVAAVRLCSTG